MPAGSVAADFELGRERAFGDLTVDGGPGQSRPDKNGFQANDTVWVSHGHAASCSLLLTASETRQDRALQARKGIYTSRYCGVQTAVNRTGQIPMPRPRPRSRPWAKASSRLSLRPVSKEMPSSILRLARIDSICGSRSRPRAMSPIAERVAL